MATNKECWITKVRGCWFSKQEYRVHRYRPTWDRKTKTWIGDTWFYMYTSRLRALIGEWKLPMVNELLKIVDGTPAWMCSE